MLRSLALFLLLSAFIGPFSALGSRTLGFRALGFRADLKRYPIDPNPALERAILFAIGHGIYEIASLDLEYFVPFAKSGYATTTRQFGVVGKIYTRVPKVLREKLKLNAGIGVGAELQKKSFTVKFIFVTEKDVDFNELIAGFEGQFALKFPLAFHRYPFREPDVELEIGVRTRLLKSLGNNHKWLLPEPGIFAGILVDLKQ